MGELRSEGQAAFVRSKGSFAEAKLTEACEWRFLDKFKKG